LEDCVAAAEKQARANKNIRYATNRVPLGKTSFPSKTPSSIRCNHCNAIGHKKADCPKLKKKRKEINEAEEESDSEDGVE
jgi:hypothetical protein